MKKSFFIPESLNLPELVSQLNNKKLIKSYFLDKCHYLIDSLYLRRLSFCKNKSEMDYLPVHAKTLENVLTPRFAAVVKKTLVELKVIEQNHNRGYQRGKRSKSYRFTDPFRESRFHAVPIADRKLIKKLELIHRARRAKEATKNLGRALIVESLDRLWFDCAAASDYVSNTTYGSEGSLAARLRAIQAFKDGQLFDGSDRQGRLYHNLTNLGSDLRQFASFEGESLVFVDVSHCHPALLAAYYGANDGEEKRRYVETVKRGELYSLINSKLKNPYDLTVPSQKREFKEEAFRKIFYGSNYGSETEPLTIFKTEFPYLASRLRDAKKRHHSDLPVELMRRESKLVIDGAACEFAKRHALDRPNPSLLSLHDCLVTTEGHVSEVKGLLEDAFRAELGFAPRITVKKT